MSALESPKEKLAIPDLWRLRNWRGKPGRSCRVPYREDQSPSGSILPNDGLFHDFTSGETFDAPGSTARVGSERAGCVPAIHPARRRRGKIANSAAHEVHTFGKRAGILQSPPLDAPTPADLRQLAAVRCVSIEACEAAADCKHLFFATRRGGGVAGSSPTERRRAGADSAAGWRRISTARRCERKGAHGARFVRELANRRGGM